MRTTVGQQEQKYLDLEEKFKTLKSLRLVLENKLIDNLAELEEARERRDPLGDQGG